MPLSPQPISWPLTGGLDTDTGPLSVVPGSHLDLSDCTQERKDEWRARYGFASSAQDSLPNGIAPLIGSIGDAGMFALNDKLATYQPSLTSNRWSTWSLIGMNAIVNTDDISRVPVTASDNPICGFARSGNFYIVANLDSVSPAVVVMDSAGKTHARYPLTAGLYLRARCAVTAGKLVAYLASTAGNLDAMVIDVGTGVVTGGAPSTIKAGAHATAPYLGALWDGSSATITVVVRMAAGDAVRFIEHNPVTGALATDVALAGIVANSALELFQDYSASGVRFVATSDTTGPTTRVLRVTSAGTISQNDLADTVAACAITGVGYSAGSRWTAVYEQASANTIKVARRESGLTTGQFVVGTSLYSVPISLDGQAWSPDGVTMQFLTGMHSTSTSDPQDSWIMTALPLASGVSGGLRPYRLARIAPLQAQAYLNGAAATQSALYQRAASGHASYFALPVLADYSLTGGTIARQYSIDVFTQQTLQSADIGTVMNRGVSVPYKQTTFIPTGSASYVDEGGIYPIGTSVPPPQPEGVAATATGGLTLLAKYGFVFVWELLDSDGNIWRSPPSVPQIVTLTGTQNTVNFTDFMSMGITNGMRWRVKLYQTAGNGSVYRLAAVATGNNPDVVQLNMTALADATLVNDDVLYTTGELATAITPRFSHMALFGDRLWGINADFRTELWPSKNLRPGRQPEFVAEGTVDIDDNYGDLTGIIGLDGNGVAFKQNAIYFITGEGLTDAGSGQAHNYQQVATGIGAIPGSPLVVAGDKVYFVSSRGIHSIDRGANLAYAGAGIDKWFNQPQIATPETVYDAVFMPKQNEVRFVTTNYVFVFDLKYQTWVRYSLAGFRRCLNINDAMVLFKTDGTVWREGDASQTTDNGTPYNGIIRSAWIRPTTFGQIRLYRGLVLGERTGGGGNVTPTMQIYEDNSDTPVQSFTPPTPVMAGTLVVQAEARPQRQNCSAFSLQVTLPPSDTTFRLAKWGAEIGARGGRAQKQPAGNSWR